MELLDIFDESKNRSRVFPYTFVPGCELVGFAKI